MHVVIATPFYPPENGVLGMYAEGLEKAFRARGDTVHVISFGRHSHVPAGIRHLLYFLRVYRVAKNASFVLALDTWSVGLPAFFAARFARRPLLVRVGGDFLWESYVERTHEQMTLSEFYEKKPHLSLREKIIRGGTLYLVQRARILFTTRFQRALWHRAYDTPADALIVENYFPPAVGTYLPAQGPVLVSAGRTIALKNKPLLERVIARCVDTHPGLTLDTRFLQGEEHGRRLAEAHAVIIPSFSEVCSNTAIDAVSLGKPFIMASDTGTSERLGACGLFIDTRSEGALTQAIETLLDPLTYEKYATAARTFSFTHSFEQMAEEIAAAAV